MNQYELMRLRAGLSQVDAAKKLGVTQSTVSFWENGIHRPNAKVLHKISHLYGVTVDELLGEEARKGAGTEKRI